MFKVRVYFKNVEAPIEYSFEMSSEREDFVNFVPSAKADSRCIVLYTPGARKIWAVIDASEVRAIVVV